MFECSRETCLKVGGIPLVFSGWRIQHQSYSNRKSKTEISKCFFLQQTILFLMSPRTSTDMMDSKSTHLLTESKIHPEGSEIQNIRIEMFLWPGENQREKQGKAGWSVTITWGKYLIKRQGRQTSQIVTFTGVINYLIISDQGDRQDAEQEVFKIKAQT